MDNYTLGTWNVQSMDVQEEAGFLLASYASGSIALWDLVDYKLLKNI